MKLNIPIYTTADWGYRGPLFVMLASLSRHLRVEGKQKVFILTKAADAMLFCAEKRLQFANLEVEFVIVDTAAIERLPLFGHVGMMTYLRLQLESAELCPWDRILYLDSDILVRGDLAPLLSAVTNQEAAIAGVRECGTYEVSGAGGVFNWQALGLDQRQPYINAGVLGLRLEVVRQEALFSRAQAHLTEHGKNVIGWDQEAINAVAGAHLSAWPERYNYTSSYLRRRNQSRLKRDHGVQVCAQSDVIIAHFTGSGACKPWHINSISPFVEEYMVYMASSQGIPFPPLTTRLEKWIGHFFARVVRRAVSSFELCLEPVHERASG